jgi:hypothetical protein
LVAMQGQLANIQQFCMTVSQQPPSGICAPAQQQRTLNNHNKRNCGRQGSSCGFSQQPTMSFGGTGGSQQHTLCPPTPYKRWENWDYCHTHNGDVDDTHTSMTCGKPGPTHNLNATRANIMGGLVVGMHKTILPLACGHTPPNHRPQQLQLLQQCIWRHGLAATNSSCTVWWNATGQHHLLPADNHGHAGLSALPRNDDECQPIPFKCRKRANDADGPTADGSAHVDVVPPTSSPTSSRGTFDK